MAVISSKLLGESFIMQTVQQILLGDSQPEYEVDRVKGGANVKRYVRRQNITLNEVIPLCHLNIYSIKICFRHHD